MANNPLMGIQSNIKVDRLLNDAILGMYSFQSPFVSVNITSP